jgi:hypothetical protein
MVAAICLQYKFFVLLILVMEIVLTVNGQMLESPEPMNPDKMQANNGAELSDALIKILYERSESSASSGIMDETSSHKIIPVDIYIHPGNFDESELKPFIKTKEYRYHDRISATVYLEDIPKIRNITSVRKIELAASYYPEKDLPDDSNRRSTVLMNITINTSNYDMSQLEPYLEEIIDRQPNKIKAYVYWDALPKIKEIPSIIDIEELETGNYLDKTINSCPLLKALNVSCPSKGGKGIRVVVIDSEFYQDRMNSSMLEIIDEERTKGYRPFEIHGSACTEIVGQIVPDASIEERFLGYSLDQFKELVDELKKRNQTIDVVSCSMDLYAGPGLFGIHDDLYYAIKNLTEKGTIWVNAAGNSAQRHWMGEFSDPEGDGFNNFNGSDESINVTLNRSDLLLVYLTWDDWPDPNYGNSTEDYALWVKGPRNEDRQISDDPQKGFMNQIPEECISMTTPRYGIYQLKIQKKSSGKDASRFHLFIDSNNENVTIDTNLVSESSLGCIARYDNVLTVGAIDPATRKIEPYSSMGPANKGLLKPDIVAPTNSSVLTTYPNNFTGTSAATPAVAGCIALALSNNLQAKDIISQIKKNAIDLGRAGPDFVYGYGLINMGFIKGG